MREFLNLCTRGPWNTSGLGVQWKNTRGVLAFQCSKGIADWLFNLFCAPIWYEGDLVHAGFASLYESVRDEALAAAGLGRVVITGHSQGAAIATLFHRELVRDGRLVETITFGSPRVFASPVNLPGLINIQNRADIVCAVPPFRGYQHVGEVRLIGPERIKTPLGHRAKEYLKYLE